MRSFRIPCPSENGIDSEANTNRSTPEAASMKSLRCAPSPSWYLPLPFFVFVSGSTQEGNDEAQAAGKIKVNRDLSHNPARFRHFTFSALTVRRADECSGDIYAEADAEDGGVGLLRREDAAGAARQVR